MSSKKKRTLQAKAAVADHREYFERAVLRSNFASGDESTAGKQDLISRTRREFDLLDQKTSTGDVEGISDSAQVLARMRAYLWPVDEAKQEGKGLLSVMEQWGVPRIVLKELQAAVEKMRDCPEPRMRALLYQLYADHDYWSSNIDSLFDQRKIAARVAASMTVAGAALAYLLFLYTHVLWGFIAAASAGSALSIMRRPPPVDVYSRVADFEARAIRRFISGVMGSLLALGLVHAGVVVIPLPRGIDVTHVFDACVQGCGWAQSTVLFAFGLTLGFSERLLTSVGDALIPSRSKASTHEHAAKSREDPEAINPGRELRG